MNLITCKIHRELKFLSAADWNTSGLLWESRATTRCYLWLERLAGFHGYLDMSEEGGGRGVDAPGGGVGSFAVWRGGYHSAK